MSILGQKIHQQFPKVLTSLLLGSYVQSYTSTSVAELRGPGRAAVSTHHEAKAERDRESKEARREGGKEEGKGQKFLKMKRQPESHTETLGSQAKWDTL